MKSISVVSPCYNEEANVRELYERVRAVMVALGEYTYEHLFIDNASTDGTFGILKELARLDRNVKIIRNSRNFGHIRSPMYAIHQTRGDAVVCLASDLQDPPELIADMVRAWENGTPVIVAIRKASDENPLMYWVRTKYYHLVRRLSNIETYEHFTGFGLYDRKVIDMVKQFRDPYPYFRGMIAEIGLPHLELPYRQANRKRGKTKNNFYSLYDLAMLGITNLSKVPLRIVTLSGLLSSVLCILVGTAYLLYKLLFWDRFSVGMAPVVVGVFFFASIQLFFMGILGEYIGAIHTLVQDRPLVVENERINFEYPPGAPLTGDCSLPDSGSDD